MPLFRLLPLLIPPLVWSCSASDATPTPVTPVAVEAVEPKVRQYQKQLHYTGKLESAEDTELFARIGGVLVERHFQDGQWVKEGDPLFALDDRELAAAVSIARAEVAAAAAEVDVTGRNLQRGQDLTRNRFISRADLDSLGAAALRAKAQLEAAAARLEAAQTRLSYAIIKAPFSGRISDSKVARGQLIFASQTPLANLVSIDPMLLTFHVEETARKELLSQIGTSQIVAVLQRDGAHYKQQGKVGYIANRVDAKSGTLMLQAVFPNPDGELLPGEHVGVELRLGEPQAVVTVPRAALQSSPGGDFLYTVDDKKKVRKLSVVAGPRLEDEVVLASRVSPQEQVIVRGTQHVKAGMSVVVGTSSDE